MIQLLSLPLLFANPQNHFDYVDQPLADPVYVEKELYQKVIEQFPIPCVDIFVYNPINQTYLLVLRDQEPAKGFWWLPGGRMKKGESFFDTALRKCEIEVGLKNVIPIRQIGRTYNTIFPTSAWDCPTQTINTVVFALYESEEGPNLDANHAKYRWETIDTAPEDPYIRSAYMNALYYLKSKNM